MGQSTDQGDWNESTEFVRKLGAEGHWKRLALERMALVRLCGMRLCSQERKMRTDGVSHTLGKGLKIDYL